MNRKPNLALRAWLALALSSLCCLAQSPSAPTLTRPTLTHVDPPNWWPALPDPMLLLYGDHLDSARFAVSGHGVRLIRSQSSANGHYAFLWLATQNSAPQTLAISASNAAGSASLPYALKARHSALGRYQGFNSADAMYLIMTDRFADGDPSNNAPGYAPDAPRGWHGGDLRGIDRHLDYLQQLGITTLWTTPVLSNGAMPDSYHGYAAVDLCAIDSHYGSLDDYQHLADDLHTRGMKLVFDIVPNHIGVQHPWVSDPPAPDWLHGTLAQHSHVRYNFEVLADPHTAPADAYDITHGWFTDSVPDLNQENPLVSTYLIQDAIWWIETVGLDGLRIDTFPYVARSFWHDFHRTIHSLYPNLTTVGEVFNGDPTVTSFFAGGPSHEGIDTGLDTPFDFPVYFTLRDVLLHGKPMTALAAVLAQDHLYPHPERLVTFFGNHDTKRFISEPGADLAKLKLAFALIVTLRGMPEIYSGDEIAMEGNDDPDNRRDFPGGFPSATQYAFTPAGRTPSQQEAFAWVSSLLQMRREEPAITSGQQQDIFSDATGFVFLRGTGLEKGCSGSGPDRVLVLVNNAPQPRKFELPTAGTALESCSQFKPLALTSPPSVVAQNSSVVADLGPESAAVYAVR